MPRTHFGKAAHKKVDGLSYVAFVSFTTKALCATMSGLHPKATKNRALATITVELCVAPDRHATERMFGLRADLRRGASAANFDFVCFLLLQSVANVFIAAQGCADW